MVGMHGIAKGGSYGKYAVGNSKKNDAPKKADAAKSSTAADVKSSEYKLSDKAQKYLDKLRKDYGDYDFVIADAGDDLKGLMKQSTKEFSVVFSSEELEKMADDEKFASKQMQHVDTAVNMSKQICEQFGYERMFGKDNVSLNSVSVSFDDKGITSMFAELEKSTAERNTQMQKQIEEKRAEDKADAKKSERPRQTVAEYKAKMQKVIDEQKKRPAPGETVRTKNLEKIEPTMVQRAPVNAKTIDELFRNMKNIDWNKVPAEVAQAGDKIGYSA
ncbi:MAG: hypothetical protein IK990_20695 [Ruminiclostridium sp.]|nr:hypothetical protein [Ruminiclostridium sp.]